jgi:hypothetical protein
MRSFQFSFLIFVLVFFIACNGEAESDKTNTVSEKQDSIIEVSKEVLNGNLESEWVLEAINGKATDISLNIIFNINGEFSQKMSSSTVNGTFKKSKDGKIVSLKSEKGDDKWEILELTDSSLTVLDLHPENKAEFKFKK